MQREFEILKLCVARPHSVFTQTQTQTKSQNRRVVIGSTANYLADLRTCRYLSLYTEENERRHKKHGE